MHVSWPGELIGVGLNRTLGRLRESVQCDDTGPIPVAGPAYTHAVGGNLTVVCKLGFLA